jgi:hypothetical protein
MFSVRYIVFNSVTQRDAVYKKKILLYNRKMKLKNCCAYNKLQGTESVLKSCSFLS